MRENSDNMANNADEEYLEMLMLKQNKKLSKNNLNTLLLEFLVYCTPIENV